MLTPFAVNQNLSPTILHGLCSAAIEAARAAGEFIQNFDRAELQREFKQSGSSAASQIVTAVDLQSEQLIYQHLQRVSKPLDIAFVGEESAAGTFGDNDQRFKKPYFWCVDPLDGTLPFVEGRSGYAVSIALLEQTGAPVIGVVFDPLEQVLYHAIRGQGCYRKSALMTSPQHKSESLLVYADQSLKTHPQFETVALILEKCAASLGLKGVTFVIGRGAVLNACQTLESANACYLKLPKKADGGGSIWDFAATACLAREGGIWVSDVYGKPLDLNRQKSTFMNHKGVLFASSQPLARSILTELAYVAEAS